MFKYFHNFPNEESVYKLVTGEKSENNLNGNGKFGSKSRYRSIHSAKVRDEAVKSKVWPCKTMGVPKVPVENPEMFLKKQSKRPLSVRPKSVSASTLVPREKGCQTIQTGDFLDDQTTNDNLDKAERPETQPPKEKVAVTEHVRPKTCYHRRCLTSSARKPPVPDSTLGVDLIIRDNKDFIKSNALTTISSSHTKPKDPILYVDTVKGDTRKWLNSGLAPQYVNQKKFAHVPVYITVRKKEFLDQLKKRQEEEREKAENSQVRILEKEVRDKIIESLQQNWNEIFTFYQRLPLLIDTPGKIKRKTGMEAQMKKLETDIQILQRHDSIYVSEIAPRSFYAYGGGGATNCK